jgi:sensor histidine kinase YesM
MSEESDMVTSAEQGEGTENKVKTPGGLRYTTVLVHVLCWVIVLVFYTRYFGRTSAAYRESALFVGLLMPITIGTTYFLTSFLIPRFLLKRRYAKFALYFIYTLVVSVNLELLVLIWIFILVAVTYARPIHPVAFDVWSLVIAMYLVVFVAVAIDLVARWYRMQSENTRLENARLEAELKLKEAELKLLKGQIQPHFLFNTLNSLYALTLEKSPEAPDLVLRLSDMLDYILHRGDRQKLSLKDEIAYLRNYLSMEQVRCGNRAHIRFEDSGYDGSDEIAPLLLIPLVENAFKHGVSRTTGEASVSIELAVDRGILSFSVTNTVPETASHSEPSGLGLQNLKRRLNLLYPNRHKLEIRPGEGQFEALLQLTLYSGGEM